ncbi:hypothetical protein [Azospirillum sp. TSO22-1]|uniref:hypothetical protein n=1 Tax=Azospirillum sp. TSO22-1 TaxID=716789 RepID=UPI0011B6DFA3|nr:hypothetical protein [Azospirillum sp. TSO22-1]
MLADAIARKRWLNRLTAKDSHILRRRITMADPTALARPTLRHLLLAGWCVLSMRTGALAMDAPPQIPLDAGTLASTQAPIEGASRVPLPEGSPADEAKPAATQRMIRVYYTDTQGGGTTASFFPVSMSGPSAACGMPITEHPLCRGVTLQCQRAADGAFRWVINGFCE